MSSAGVFFDKFADHFDTFYDGKRSRLMQWIDWRFRRDMFLRFEMTFELLGDLHGKTILDIGCGSGPYIAEALRRGAAHILGIDPAPRMLELAAERARKVQAEDRVQLIEGLFPGSSLPLPQDAAIVMGVMDYVPDPAAFLGALRKVVRDSAVLSFPSRHWFRTPFRKLRYWLRRCPVWFYDQEQISRLGREAGFSAVRVRKIAGAGMDYVVQMTP